MEPTQVHEKVDRSKLFMVMAAKKEDSDMKPLLFQDTQIKAEAAAAAFRLSYFRVEVWKQVVGES